MASDALELKGWAQVLNQPNSQLGQMAALKQRQQQFTADQALKQQQADEKWWTDNVKLGFDDVRNELQQHEAELFKATHAEMVNTQKEILAGRMNQNEGRTKILQLQNNYDANRQLISSFNKNVDDLTEAYKAQKDLYDNAYVSSRVKKLMTDAYRREPDGSLTFNKEAVLGLQDVLSDPKAINLATLGKQYASKLGMIESQYLEDYGDSWVDKTTKVSPLFQTEEKTVNGRKILTIKKDPNTGLPLANNSPEAIREWDSQGEIYSKKLDDLAKTDGITRAEAFAKYISPFGKAEEEVAKSGYKPGYYSSGAGKPEYNFSVVTGINTNLKDPEQITDDGMIGTTAKSVDMQGLVTNNLVLKDKNGADVNGRFLGFQTDADGNDAIAVQKYDPAAKIYGQTELVPFNDKNQNTVENAVRILKNPNAINSYNKVKDEYLKSGKEALKKDDAAIQKVVDDVSSVFDNTSINPFKGKDDNFIAEEIRKKLLNVGIDKPVKVNQKSIWGLGFSNPSVTIGDETITLDSAGKKKLADYIYKNNKPKFAVPVGQEPATPQFDPTKF